MQIKFGARFQGKLMILVFVLLYSTVAFAADPIYLYTYLSSSEIAAVNSANSEPASNRGSISAIVLTNDAKVLILPAGIYSLQKLNLFLVLINISDQQSVSLGVDQFEISNFCGKTAAISFASNDSEDIGNEESLNWYNFECFQGNQEKLIEELRSKIETQRSEFQQKKTELAKSAAATNRLRRDARLIAGYDRLEELKSEAKSILAKLEIEEAEQLAIRKSFKETQISQEPRSFSQRQAVLAESNKELITKTGGAQDLQDPDAGTISNEVYQKLKGIDLSILEDNLNRLTAERISLERSFGYAPGEFRLLRDW